MTVRAVLPDIAGPLLGSNDAHAHAWVDTGREFGCALLVANACTPLATSGDAR